MPDQKEEEQQVQKSQALLQELKDELNYEQLKDGFKIDKPEDAQHLIERIDLELAEINLQQT